MSIKWLSATENHRLPAVSVASYSHRKAAFSRCKIFSLAVEGFRLLMAIFCIVVFTTPAKGNEIPIAVSGEPRATLQIGANASEQEQFAAEEIQAFIQQFTGAKLDIRTNRQQTETPTAIVLGDPKIESHNRGTTGEHRTLTPKRTRRRRLSYQNS